MTPVCSRRAWLAGVLSVLPACRLMVVNDAGAGRDSDAEARLAAIEHRLEGRLGVAVLDTGSGRRLTHRASERFAMCSTFKFLAAAAVLSRVDQSVDRLDRFVHYGPEDLLEYAPITKQHVKDGGMALEALAAAAIEYSDNTAANLLLETIGGPAGLTRFVRELGDGVTRLDRNEPTLNVVNAGDVRDTTSPGAMLEDMKMLLLGTQALSTASQQLLTTWIVANTTGGDRLRAGLPATWRVGDKTGTGANGATNDIAIAWPPGSSPILIASYFTDSPASLVDRNGALAEVGHIVASASGGTPPSH